MNEFDEICCFIHPQISSLQKETRAANLLIWSSVPQHKILWTITARIWKYKKPSSKVWWVFKDFSSESLVIDGLTRFDFSRFRAEWCSANFVKDMWCILYRLFEQSKHNCCVSFQVVDCQPMWKPITILLASKTLNTLLARTLSPRQLKCFI